MAIDPAVITGVKFQGDLLTGKIISVGKDGMFDYDYDHPQTAFSAASNGDVILIYPGTYSPLGSYTCLNINKNINIYVVGMGQYPDEVVLTTPSDIWHTIAIDYTNATNMFVVIENLTSTAARTSSGAVVHRQCSASTVTILNKLRLEAAAGYTVYFGDTVSYADYRGDCYISNCTILRGSYHLREVGRGSNTSTISLENVQYTGGSYACLNCARNPSPHDYVTSFTTDYGHLFGDSMFEFLLKDAYVPPDTSARNIWTKNNFVYRPNEDGVAVHDLTTTSAVALVNTPVAATTVWVNEETAYIGTAGSGIYALEVATITGTPNVSLYKSYPDIQSNYVNYLHGAAEFLCVATESGMDRFRLDSPHHSFITTDNPDKCFQTTSGEFYYYTNPPIKVKELGSSVLNWKYVKVVTLSHTITQDDYIFNFEIEITLNDNIYVDTKSDGSDIRLIDNLGNVLPYVFDVWDSAYNPKLWVRLNSGTNTIYVLYGNYNAVSVSSSEDTFLLFDDFDGGTLDTDKWTFSSNTTYTSYSIDKSAITLKCSNNSYSSTLVSKKGFITGHVLEALIARTYSSDISDMDVNVGFDDSGVYAYIGTVSSTDEYPLRLVSRTSWGTIQGTKFIQENFAQVSVTEAFNYQAAEFDGELLVSSGTLTSPLLRNAYFSVSNSSGQPDLKVAWARVRNYDPDPPTFTVSERLLPKDVLSHTKLHAVYSTANGPVEDGFVYTPEVTNLLITDYMNDLYVTEDTSIYGGNCLFLATTYGAMIIEEKRGDELNCRKRIYLIDS